MGTRRVLVGSCSTPRTFTSANRHRIHWDLGPQVYLRGQVDLVVKRLIAGIIVRLLHIDVEWEGAQNLGSPFGGDP